MNADETKEFIAMWHNDLDRLDSLGITAWLRAYTNIGCLEDGSPARQLQARVDAKLLTAADTIDQLTEERDEARRERDAERREYCELCAPEWGLPSPQWLAKDKGWDCYEKETP